MTMPNDERMSKLNDEARFGWQAIQRTAVTVWVISHSGFFLIRRSSFRFRSQLNRRRLEQVQVAVAP
jgi:hypothetical protein